MGHRCLDPEASQMFFQNLIWDEPGGLLSRWCKCAAHKTTRQLHTDKKHWIQELIPKYTLKKVREKKKSACSSSAASHSPSHSECWSCRRWASVRMDAFVELSGWWLRCWCDVVTFFKVIINSVKPFCVTGDWESRKNCTPKDTP